MEASPDTTPPKRRRHRFRNFMIAVLLLALLGFVIYYFVAGMTYSEGTRSGVLVKISRKGYVFKTYEGELNEGGFTEGAGTIMPTRIFRFSVNDKLVYQTLDSMQGHKVVLRYKEVIHSFFWQGETNYFVVGATYYK